MLEWDDHLPRHVPDGTVSYGVLRDSLANSHTLLARKSKLESPSFVFWPPWKPPESGALSRNSACAWRTSLLKSQICLGFSSYDSMH